MMEPDLEAYQNAVEGLHGAPATFDRIEHVKERHGDAVAWEGDVYVFQPVGPSLGRPLLCLV